MGAYAEMGISRHSSWSGNQILRLALLAGLIAVVGPLSFAATNFAIRWMSAKPSADLSTRNDLSASDADVASKVSEDTPIGSPASDWSDAYTRLNFKLGMTVDEFRSSRLSGESDAYPVCSNDPISQEEHKKMAFEFKQPFRDVGGITCVIVYKGHNGDIFQVDMDFGSTSTRHNYFYFYKFGSGGSYVLFLIEVWTPTVEKFGEISEAYVKRFGKPTSADVEDVQNGFGAVFHNEIVTFANNSSVIRLTKYDGSLDHFTAMYWLKQVASEINYIRAAADKSAQKL